MPTGEALERVSKPRAQLVGLAALEGGRRLGELEREVEPDEQVRRGLGLAEVRGRATLHVTADLVARERERSAQVGHLALQPLEIATHRLPQERAPLLQLGDDGEVQGGPLDFDGHEARVDRYTRW